MQYTLETTIDLPRDRVVEMFEDRGNLQQWQPDLLQIEHLSGEPRQVGETSRLVYRMGRKQLEMVETIVVRNPPEEFSATYEAKGVWNRVDNRFIDLHDRRTQWSVESQFKCGGFMRIIALLMPGMFRKETRKYMQQFKQFAENA